MGVKVQNALVVFLYFACSFLAMGTSTYTIAFYNLENLFDVHDDPYTLDDDFTPKSDRRWNKRKYNKKINKLAYVIARIGSKNTSEPPAIVGIAEVENKRVIRDLLDTKHLRDLGYGYVHFDAPDERGIDTALLYRNQYFEPVNSETRSVLIDNLDGNRDYTRDVLHVEGLLDGEPVHFLVNHWPSRRAGPELTNYKRVAAAKVNLEIINEIQQQNPNAAIVCMGDFNDNPKSESIQKHLMQALFNPMTELHSYSRGSSKYRKQWFLFDQILISPQLIRNNNAGLQFKNADIFDPLFLREHRGRFKGNPFRTFAGNKHLGGFSDHFPVFAELRIHKI